MMCPINFHIIEQPSLGMHSRYHCGAYNETTDLFHLLLSIQLQTFIAIMTKYCFRLKTDDYQMNNCGLHFLNQSRNYMEQTRNMDPLYEREFLTHTQTHTHKHKQTHTHKHKQTQTHTNTHTHTTRARAKTQAHIHIGSSIS